MKIAILTANLGNFDQVVNSVSQYTDHEVKFHRFTDEDFPPVTGLSGRFQYRIPKMFGWEMMPDYDMYLWFDSSMALKSPDALNWFLRQMEGYEMGFFKHPWRKTLKEEVDHIEEYLRKGNEYITSRYKNGFHKEMYWKTIGTPFFKDNTLYASTVFMYRNTQAVKDTLRIWWFYQSRYYTCDQVNLPLALFETGVSHIAFEGDLFKNHYIDLVSKHK